MSKPTFYIINSWQTFVADLNPLMHCVPLEYICLQFILIIVTYLLHALHLFNYFHHTCSSSSCIHDSTWSQVTFEVSRNILVIRNNLVVFIMGFALSWMTLLPGLLFMWLKLFLQIHAYYTWTTDIMDISLELLQIHTSNELFQFAWNTF